MGKKQTDTQPLGIATQTTQDKYGQVGWICPVCGAGVSPYVSVCPHCISRHTSVDELDPFKYRDYLTPRIGDYPTPYYPTCTSNMCSIPKSDSSK